MAAVKKPCFNYQAATAGKEKDFGLKASEIRPIWEYAKKRYLENGTSYEETINELVRETGAPARFFEEVFTGPKTARGFRTKEMFAKEDARRNAIYQAHQNIARADMPAWARYVRMGSEIPRATLTAFHGGVFPVTHGGALLLRPRAWGAFIRGAKVSWGVFDLPGGTRGKAYYEKERLRLQNEEVGGIENRAGSYADWRSAGLKIGVDERAQGVLTGWLASKPGWSSRSWLGLMRMRYELADGMMKNFKPANDEERLSIMKSIAEIANHATGVSNIQVFGPLSKGLFAPQLTASKLLRVTHDPVTTVWTAMKMMSGKPTTAGERAAMQLRTTNMMEMLGTWAAGLFINGAILDAFGSKQKINWTDPSKGDWLRFKTGEGHVLASRGPEEALRLFGQLIAVGAMGRRELGRSGNPWDEASDKTMRYILSKLSPGIGLTGELLYGTDYFSGRPLPKPIQWARTHASFGYLKEQLPRAGKPQFSTPEYIMQHIPIFLTGPARDVYEDMRDRGLSEPDANSIVHAAVVMAGEFAGFGGYREKASVQEPTRYKKGSARTAP